ncbi:MAG TPA: class I SAM-dependent methyltransferase [Polyangia bacterium]|nr:class I SAM-dependent methyltransferase [Polyangia bacterium]
MRQRQSSRTAEGMALVRAIEAQRPEGKRICYDPLARALVPGVSVFFSKLVIDSGLYGHFVPGVIEFITARERYIDDFLHAALNEGLDQVVFLGAGFDTRAYRTPGIEKTRVFEVDHPATQAAKLKRLKKVISPLPAHVTFVPVDFNTQTLGDRLLASGYNERGKTLFIWQGVTMYLTQEGVDSTLAFIAQHAGPGSAVIFDYFYNETLRDKSRREVRLMWQAARVTGEAYLFGIDAGQIEPFLTRRGFRDVRNTTSEDLTRLYFTGPNAGRAVAPGIAIASARV